MSLNLRKFAPSFNLMIGNVEKAAPGEEAYGLYDAGNAPARDFRGGIGLDRKGVDRRPDVRRQQIVNQPLTIDAGTALEGRGDDLHPEVGLTAGTGTGMPFMPVGFVNHNEAQRLKTVGQLLVNAIGNRQSRSFGPVRPYKITRSPSPTLSVGHVRVKTRKKGAFPCGSRIDAA